MKDERGGHTSASNAESDGLCPGRFQAQKDLPEIKTEEAESGNRIHAALAGEETTLSPEEQESVTSCQAIADKIIADWMLR